MTAHARYSPSGSKRWRACPGSLVLEAAFPDTGSAYSDVGSAKHDVGSRCLLAKPHEPQYATAFIGQQINVAGDGEEDRFVTFTNEYAEEVNDYIAAVREKAAAAELVMIEHRVDFSEFAGVPGQFGTADAILLYKLDDGTYELDITDAKFGFKVVSPVENPQLMTYALGAYRELELAYEITQIRCSIFQPEQGGMVSWQCTIGDLMAFAATVRTAVERCEEAAQQREIVWAEEWERRYLNPNPNEEECAFCRAQATCPAMRRKMEEVVGASFEVISEEGVDQGKLHAADDSYLSKAMRAAGLLEDWILAVRAEVERRLMAGIPVEGYGLELGREGIRKWSDPERVKEYLKRTVRLPDELIYKQELLGPAQIEKLAGLERGKPRKVKEGEKTPLKGQRWTRLVPFIVRAEAKPSVKPIEKIKEPWSPKPLDDGAFDVVPEGGSEDLY